MRGLITLYYSLQNMTDYSLVQKLALESLKNNIKFIQIHAYMNLLNSKGITFKLQG